MSSSDEEVTRRRGRSGAGDRQNAGDESYNTPAQNERFSDNMNGDEDDADLFGSDDAGGEASNDEYGVYPLLPLGMRC